MDNNQSSYRNKNTAFFSITRAKAKVLPVQFSPSPMKPFLQVQLCPPLVLLHMARSLQLCVSVAHSSISEKQFIRNRQLVTLKAS